MANSLFTTIGAVGLRDFEAHAAHSPGYDALEKVIWQLPRDLPDGATPRKRRDFIDGLVALKWAIQWLGTEHALDSQGAQKPL